MIFSLDFFDDFFDDLFSPDFFDNFLFSGFFDCFSDFFLDNSSLASLEFPKLALHSHPSLDTYAIWG